MALDLPLICIGHSGERNIAAFQSRQNTQQLNPMAAAGGNSQYLSPSAWLLR
jgi:hypothetical protein